MEINKTDIRKSLSLTSLSKLVDCCLKISPAHPIVFFVGSGVSTAYPSVLPSVTEMISETVRAISPSPLPDDEGQLIVELEKLAWMLPEIYYENIANVLGQDALQVWEALRFWNEKDELAAMNLGPNSGHYLIVYLAWKGKAPIITTNFDMLFEEAANRLGLHPVVTVPKEGEYRVVSEKDAVSIWKVHGSVEIGRFSSIHTTLQTITAVDLLKLNQIKIQFSRTGACVCFLGYSGRDIDLFPFISTWEIPEKIFWLDKDFSEWHNIHNNPDRFLAIKSTSVELVTQALCQIDSNDEILDRLRILHSETTTVTGDKLPEEAKLTYTRATSFHIHIVFSKLLSENDPRKDLIHAISLHSIGLYKNAFGYIDRYLDAVKSTMGDQARLLVKAFLLRASLSHAVSKYEDSEKCAFEAYKLAKSERLLAIQDEATIALDEALRMQHLPRLNYQGKLLLLRPETWILLLRFSIHAYQLSRHRNKSKYQAGADALRVDFIFLEHLVRLFGSLQGLLLLLFPKSIVKGLMKGIWNYIETQSQSVGFANGIGFARRYAERLGIPPSTSPLISSMPIFELLGESTGKAIAYRDLGDRLFETVELETDTEKQKPMIKEATAAYESGYFEAIESGNASLALKLLISRRRLDPNFRAPREETVLLLNGIQGKGYRRVEDDLIDWLCELSGLEN